MSGLDKILEHITQEADAQVKNILEGANKAAGKLLKSEKEETENIAAAIMKQSDHDVAVAAKRIQSAAELNEKRIILKAKQDRIEGVFRSALERLNSLDNDKYSEMICKMVDRYASGAKGEISFRKEDLKRLSAAAKENIAGHNLTISGKSGPAGGGFVLSYGDIEENCSFEVLIESSKEELQDRIGKLLFS